MHLAIVGEVEVSGGEKPSSTWFHDAPEFPKIGQFVLICLANGSRVTCIVPDVFEHIMLEDEIEPL